MISRALVMIESVKQVVREKYATIPDLRDLQKETRAAVGTIRKFARAEGLRRKWVRNSDYKKITPLVAKQIAEEYARNPNSRRVGEMFGLSHQGVLNVVRKEGGKVRAREHHRAFVAEVLAEVRAA